MKGFIGYIRVSTPKQGERGVSLQEQKSAIESFARRNGLAICEWIEERETAAKRGRPEFARMFAALRMGKASGVIIHKIDRSSRNLKDWADLGELIDKGIVVHFASENLDLNSPAGRMAADIQAVVAAGYVRNLREEVRKGFYGRLKQGILPLPAPMGYLDRGRGQPKVIDPETGPLVRWAFEQYATGSHTLYSLLCELRRRGLRSRRGGPLSLSGLSTMLRNPFYIGLIRIRKRGEIFEGAHAALVPKTLFEDVRSILQGRLPQRIRRHAFQFRQLARCETCGRRLYGERQKGYIYYRCHTRACRGTSVREEAIDAAIYRKLQALHFTPTERRQITDLIGELRSGWAHDRRRALETAQLHVARIEDRLGKLTDALLDGLLDRESFDARKAQLLLDKREALDRVDAFSAGTSNLPDQIEQAFELAYAASLSHKLANEEEKRELVKSVISNVTVRSKNVAVALKIPFEALASRPNFRCGGPYRGTTRTGLASLIDSVATHLAEHPTRSAEWLSVLQHGLAKPARIIGGEIGAPPPQ